MELDHARRGQAPVRCIHDDADHIVARQDASEVIHGSRDPRVVSTDRHAVELNRRAVFSRTCESTQRTSALRSHFANRVVVGREL